MSLTLVEAAKLTQDLLLRGVVETIVSTAMETSISTSENPHCWRLVRRRAATVISVK